MAGRGRPRKVKQGVTQHEFAQLDGCSVATVNVGLKRGHLKVFADGSIDPMQAKGPWRSSNRRQMELVGDAERDAKAPNRQEQENEEPTIGMKLSEAERSKAVYTALKLKREHDIAVGEVVPVLEGERLFVQACAEIRKKFQNLGAEHASQLAAMLKPAEVKEYLDEVVYNLLLALSNG